MVGYPVQRVYRHQALRLRAWNLELLEHWPEVVVYEPHHVAAKPFATVAQLGVRIPPRGPRAHMAQLNAIDLSLDERAGAGVVLLPRHPEADSRHLPVPACGLSAGLGVGDLAAGLQGWPPRRTFATSDATGITGITTSRRLPCPCPPAVMCSRSRFWTQGI